MIQIKTYSKPKEGITYSGTVVTGTATTSSSSSSSTTPQDNYFYLDNNKVVCRYKLGTTENEVDLQAQINDLKTKLNAVYAAYVAQNEYINELMKYVYITSPHNVEIDGDLMVNGVISHN